MEAEGHCDDEMMMMEGRQLMLASLSTLIYLKWVRESLPHCYYCSESCSSAWAKGGA